MKKKPNIPVHDWYFECGNKRHKMLRYSMVLLSCCIAIVLGSQIEVTVERISYNSFRCIINGPDTASPIAIHHPPGTSFGYCKKTESPPCDPEKNLSIDPESTNIRVIVNVSKLTSFGVYQCQYKGISKNINITGEKNTRTHLKHHICITIVLVILVYIIKYILL